ncbi:hypothetical protein ACVWZ3_008627 [Bradyrhizobium sp. i1.3.6]
MTCQLSPAANSGARMCLACASITAIASPVCSAQITGTPRLMIAAFSPAMEVSVSPRKSMWSMLMGVITQAAGCVDHIGRIEPTAEADLKQHDIGRVLREQMEGSRGLQLEHGRGFAGIDPLDLFQNRAQFIVADQHPAADTAQTKTFVDADEIGRGVGMDPQARGLQRRAQISERRALAVGAGDVDHRR